MSVALSHTMISDQASLPGQDQLVVARRNGKRPLTFAGIEVCSAMSYEPGTPFWYEINIYRTSAHGFVGVVKMFSKSDDERDRSTAIEAESLDEIVHWLETYEPAHDIRCDLPFDPGGIAMVELGLRAAAASMKLAEARRQYCDLLGEVLFALDRR
jgi:hypothetical protein